MNNSNDKFINNLKDDQFKRYYDRQIFYHLKFYKYSPRIKKSKYILQIRLYEPWDAKSYKLVLLAQEYAVAEFFNNTSIDKSKVLVYTIIEPLKGIRFINDINVFRNMINNKNLIHTKYGITIAQGLMILPENEIQKMVFILPILRLFRKDEDYAVVGNYKDALFAINKFKDLPDTNKENMLF